MATIAEFLFEGAAGDGWTTSQGAIDTGVFYQGVQSIEFNCTGASKQNQLGITKRVVVGRFYFRIETDTSGTASIVQGDNANGSLTMQIRVGRKLRVNIGASPSVDSAALNLNQWYRIDFMFRSDTGTASAAYKIDGVDQTGITRAQVAADMVNFRLGNTATNTYLVNVDALKLTDQVADYPLGPYVFTVGALGLIDGSSAIYAPTVVPKYTIGALALLDGSSAIYAPTVQPDQFVGALPLLDGANAIYAPTVVPQAVTAGALPLLDAGSAIYAPSVQPDQFVGALGLIDAGSAIYSPTLVPQPVTVTLGVLDGARAVYDLEVQPDQTVDLPLIDGARDFYALTVTAGSVTAGPLDLLESASVIYDVSLQAIAGGSLPRIDSSSAIYDLSVEPQAVTADLDLIESAPDIFDLLAETGPVTVDLELLDGGSDIYPPVLMAPGASLLDLPRLTSPSAIYALSIAKVIVSSPEEHHGGRNIKITRIIWTEDDEEVLMALLGMD